MESDAQLVSSEFPIGVRLGSDQETYWPLNHFHPVLLQKSNSGLRCVFSSGGQSTQIKYLSKSTDTYNKILLQ